MAYDSDDYASEWRCSKTDMKDEWLAAGRWQEFIDVREELKGGGLTPSEAWRAADAHLRANPVGSAELPSAPGEASKPSAPSPELAGKADAISFDRESVGAAETVRWVASYLMVGDAAPEEAPSSEAWGMLQWARRNNANEASFWSQIWRQLMPTKASLESETRFTDDGKPILELIARISGISEDSDVSSDSVGS